MIKLTQNELKEWLRYDPETGHFYWLKSPTNAVKQGAKAGTIHDGYVLISIKGKVYRAHHLVWFYIHGAFPDLHMDHINGKRDDNRIQNLRLVSRSQNQCNRRRQVNNKSGYKGVYWDIHKKKWAVQIAVKGKSKAIGRFDSVLEAAQAYDVAAQQIHGEFARVNFENGGLR